MTPAGSMPYWIINVGDQGQGGIVPMPEMVPPEVPAYWMPSFGTKDVAGGVAKAKELGAKVLLEPAEVPEILRYQQRPAAIPGSNLKPGLGQIGSLPAHRTCHSPDSER